MIKALPDLGYAGTLRRRARHDLRELCMSVYERSSAIRSATVDRKRTNCPHGHNTRTLGEYFQILNSGDEARWEQAFLDTWHPEAIAHGRTCAELKVQHRSLLGKGWVDVHIVQDIDDYEIEYTTRVGGRPKGPYLATFREGRIYRVF